MARISIEQIKNEAKELNWTLVSETYKNLDTEIEFICPQGHSVITTYGIWRAKHSCPICDNPKLELSTKTIPKKKGVTRVLALDQATHDTGWSIFDGNCVIKFGVINLGNGELDERINRLKVWLANMIVVWKPDKVILEDIQLQEKKQGRTWENDTGDHVMNVNTFKTLAQLQGVLADYLYEQKMRYEFVHTAVWREHCGITGKYRTDKKKSAQLKVLEWFDLSVTNDEADAICIGYYGSAAEKRNTQLLDWS